MKSRRNSAVRALFVTLGLLWELPQTALGLLLLLALQARGGVRELSRERHRLFVACRALSVSLGYVIFYAAGSARIKRHEYGHALQSRLLGPLYLPLVGLPSVCRNLYGRLYRRRNGQAWPRYYSGFPERWADRLAER